MDFPQELMDLEQWTVWRYVNRGGKPTKIPVDPLTGMNAKSNDPSTWRTFAEALNCFKSNDDIDGMGFFFKEPYVGIDLDNIQDELDDFKRGIYDNKVFEFYEGFKSYGEVSPSGTGIHIIIKGTIPGKRRRKGNIEMYQQGRFFTMTGNSLGKYKTISEPSDQTFKRIYDKYLANDKVVHLEKQHGIQHNLSDSEIIHRILESKQKDSFQIFMNGGWQEEYTSQSEADLAFANLLAFWCARDFSMMDSIFRQSSLYRAKWDEKRGKTSYGEATLYKAINDTSNVFTPKREQAALPKYHLDFMNQPTPEKSKEYPPRSWDDTGNALRFMDRYGDIIKYSYNHKKFYVYNGEKWEIDGTGEIFKLIDLVIDDMKNEKIIVPDPADEELIEQLERDWKKHLKSSRSNRAKKALQDELKHRVSILTDEFDNADMLLNIANGYLDLSNGELKDHDKDKLFSKQVKSEYTDKMVPTVWLDFLNDIFDYDQDVIQYIQKAVGYSLSGSIKEQVMFILLGKGRNGKSLFLNTIAEILGDYAQNIRATSLMAKRQEGINNDIARLQNSRLVTSTEPNKGFRFDEGLIKQLTGDDPITARFLYGEDFEFTPKFKLWLTTNYKPIINGTDDGIWRRIVLIPFEVQIPEHKVDKDLKYKLIREAPAILNWALEGCLIWQKEGLNKPKKIAEASNDYRLEMDILERFISDKCLVGSGESIRAAEFYQLYKDWAEFNNEYTMSNKEFGEQMTEKFKKEKDRQGLYYAGVSNRESYPGLSAINK